MDLKINSFHDVLRHHHISAMINEERKYEGSIAKGFWNTMKV